MAVVETLEIRFQANMGNIGAQIGAIASKLTGLNGISAAVAGGFAQLSVRTERAVSGLDAASKKSAQSQQKLASRLKKTGSALKGVSAAAKKTAKGIGLHKLDEINLVGEQQSAAAGRRGSGSGGSAGGSISEAEKTAAAFAELWRVLGRIPPMIENVWTKFKGCFSGLGKLLNDATGGLAGRLGGLLKTAAGNAGSAFMEKFGKMLEAGKAGVIEGSKRILYGVNDALGSPSGAQSAGSRIVQSFSAAIGIGRLSARSAANSVASAANFNAGNAAGQAKQAGANLSQGFANGISSKLSAVKTSVSKVVNAAVSKIKSALKIASPSKVTFAMGGFFGEGFANGILGSVRLAENSAQRLSDGAAGMLKTGGSIYDAGEGGLSGMMHDAVSAALGGTNIVIPLSVDGVKLGEASIRGINSVTRSAGRLLLEI